MAQVIYGAPYEGARLPCDRPARLPALHRGDFFTQSPHFLAWTGGIYLHVIRAAFAPPFIQTRPAI